MQPYTSLVLIPLFNPLPVMFRSIRAYKKNENINVEWIVENESNIENYYIEKSQNGFNFFVIGSIKSISNSTVVKNYKWVDIDPSEGNNFYRIRSISNSGDVKYSEIVKVKGSDQAAFSSIYPNPVMDQNIVVHIQNVQNGIYYFNLINNEGKVLLTKAILHQSGSFNVSFALPQSLPINTYHLRLTINNASITKSIIKL